MAIGRAQANWRSLDQLFHAGALGRLTDGELLECFQASRDAAGQDAFRILVERHGPMVLGICRSRVRNPHDAEDAFQATFLVLVRKADSIRRRDTIGPWLNGVANRVAGRALYRSARKRKREVEIPAELPARDLPDSAWPPPEQLVHEEIARLPKRFLGPIVLCCLQGQSYDLAARQLGLSEPALRGRLHRARRCLAVRLRERGTTSFGATAALELPPITLPPLSSSLIESTVHFATRWTSVTGLLAGSAAIPAPIATLARGVIQTMLVQSWKLSALAGLLTASVVGTVVLARQAKINGGDAADPPGKQPPAVNAQQPDPRVGPEQERTRLQQAEQERNRLERAERERLDRAALERKTKQIQQRLGQLIDAEFPGGTTLEGVLKHIKQRTTNANFPGIPIYVNPVGLREAGKDMKAVVVINVKQRPVRTVLHDVLLGTGLSFMVKDGFLTIDSRTGIVEMRVEEIDRKLDRIVEALGRLEAPK
jgi:RNA polymerase sigma factor (sigma-70 family)